MSHTTGLVHARAERGRPGAHRTRCQCRSRSVTLRPESRRTPADRMWNLISNPWPWYVAGPLIGLGRTVTAPGRAEAFRCLDEPPAHLRGHGPPRSGLFLLRLAARGRVESRLRAGRTRWELRCRDGVRKPRRLHRHFRGHAGRPRCPPPHGPLRLRSRRGLQLDGPAHPPRPGDDRRWIVPRGIRGPATRGAARPGTASRASQTCRPPRSSPSLVSSSADSWPHTSSCRSCCERDETGDGLARDDDDRVRRCCTGRGGGRTRRGVASACSRISC